MASPMRDHLSPVAQLHTISFPKLLHKHREEQARLLDTLENDGLFYLNLTHVDSMELYKDLERAPHTMKGWFDQSVETKVQLANGSDIQGYKAIDSQTGALEGLKEGLERSDKIAQDGLEWKQKPLPEMILQSKSLFKDPS